MILSRTMREDDYPELIVQGKILRYIYYVTGMWWQAQERNSLWEYALAHKTLNQVFGNRKKLKVADYGYRMGHLSPMLVWLGHDVTMVEIGRKSPDEENFMLEHLYRVTTTRNANAGSVSIWPKPVGLEVTEEKKFDAVFSLSTLRKIGCPQHAFMDCMKLVKNGGLLFMTTSEEDSLPAVRKFNRETYDRLVEIAFHHGFRLVDNVAAWDWAHQENSFVSMVMIKEKE